VAECLMKLDERGDSQKLAQATKLYNLISEDVSGLSERVARCEMDREATAAAYERATYTGSRAAVTARDAQEQCIQLKNQLRGLAAEVVKLEVRTDFGSIEQVAKLRLEKSVDSRPSRLSLGGVLSNRRGSERRESSIVGEKKAAEAFAAEEQAYASSVEADASLLKKKAKKKKAEAIADLLGVEDGESLPGAPLEEVGDAEEHVVKKKKKKKPLVEDDGGVVEEAAPLLDEAEPLATEEAETPVVKKKKKKLVVDEADVQVVEVMEVKKTKKKLKEPEVFPV